MCAQLSAQYRRYPGTFPHHPFFITLLFEVAQLEVSRSIEVSRSPGCCFHTTWGTVLNSPEHFSTTSCENSNQGCD